MDDWEDDVWDWQPNDVTDLLKKGKGITESSRLAYLSEYKPLIYLFLTNYCSHKCWYCLGGKPYLQKNESIIDKLGVDKYLEIAMHLAGKEKVTFVLTGGDPTDHWSFKPVLKGLLHHGYDVMIQTNGQDLTAVKSVIAEIGEEYYKHISWNISFHLGQYMLESSLSNRIFKWIDNYINIVCNSEKVGVVVVMTPDILKWESVNRESLEGILDDINEGGWRFERGKVVSIQELYGTFDGKSYPTAYTDEERKRIEYLKNKYSGIPYNIDSIADVNRKLYLKGMPCFYMTRIRYVHVDGRIVICNSGLPAKAEFDIMDYKSIAPISDYPQPCIYDYCNCISMGTVACLGPSNITLDEYLKEKGDENEEERIDICSV